MKLFRLSLILLIVTLYGISPHLQAVNAARLQSVSAQDLINLINGMRVNQGLPALETHAILMSTAQSTADTMALNDLHWHIGGVSDRIQGAGYGGGAKVWATENFAIGPMTIEQIQQVWADESHMIPVVNANYVHIGAGVTEYNGRIWYIVHAAYTSGSTSNTVPTTESGEIPSVTSTPMVSQIIMPVVTATADPSTGIVKHIVQSGQSLWSIAIAYNTKIANIVSLNNLYGDTPIIQQGQELIIFEGDPELVIDPMATANFIESTSTAQAQSTLTTTPTMQPTFTKTPLPTKAVTLAPTKSAPITTEPLETQTPSPTPDPVLQNKTIGMILIGALGFGILLIVTGMLQKPK